MAGCLMRERGQSETRGDAPSFELDDAFWQNARVVQPGRKVHTGIRIDADVLDWFGAQGKRVPEPHERRAQGLCREPAGKVAPGQPGARPAPNDLESKPLAVGTTIARK